MNGRTTPKRGGAKTSLLNAVEIALHFLRQCVGEMWGPARLIPHHGTDCSATRGDGIQKRKSSKCRLVTPRPRQIGTVRPLSCLSFSIGPATRPQLLALSFSTALNCALLINVTEDRPAQSTDHRHKKWNRRSEPQRRRSRSPKRTSDRSLEK